MGTSVVSSRTTCALIGPEFSVSQLALRQRHHTICVMQSTETLEIEGVGRVVFCRPDPKSLERLRGLPVRRAWVVLSPETTRCMADLRVYLSMRRITPEYLAI